MKVIIREIGANIPNGHTTYVVAAIIDSKSVSM